MSTNVYFKDDIRRYPGFSSTPCPDGSGNKMIAAGINLFSEGGRLHSIGDNTPFELLGFVDYYSSYEWVSAERTRRETGIYRHEDAEAEVTFEDTGGKKQKYCIKLKAKKMESADTLLRLIKTGAIRPAESYEGAQQGKSRDQLESELRQAMQELEGNVAYLRKVVFKYEAVLAVLNRLRRSPWPLCRTTKILRAVGAIVLEGEE